MVARNRGLMAAAGAVFFALLLGLGLSCYLLIGQREAVRRANTAEQEQERLRNEAEKALALEKQLRQQAEVGDKLASANRLLNDGHIDDAEQAVYAVAHPASAPLLNTLAQMRVRRGEWSHAITNYTRLTELTPGEPTPYYNLAALLAYVDDGPSWQANSRRIIEQFPADRAPSVLERMAKACLIVPPRSPADLAAAVRLADIAVPGTANRKAPETFRLVRALAEYRRERFAAALRWLDGSAQEGEVARQAQAEAIRAMAQFRRGDRDTARATLAKAVGLAESLPTKGPTLSAQWPERFVAASLVREAKTLLEPSKMSKSDGAEKR